MIFFEFRVHGIQSFIFATNRLKEMVGASALIDQLTSHDIHLAIAVLGLDIVPEDFARCAGGAFLVQIRDREQAIQLQDFWSMFVSLKIPGIGFSFAMHEAERFDNLARAALTKKLQINSCRAVPAPTAGSPFAERAPLTGLPAVALEDGRLVDDASRAKRKAATAGVQIEAKLKFDDQWVFPMSFVRHDEQGHVDTLLSDFETDQYIAVIHADANGLGKIVDEVYQKAAAKPELFPELPKKFSDAIEQATHEAVRHATWLMPSEGLRDSINEPHKQVVPLRFLVLGGDDVTLVTKACHALEWVKNFQTKFQEQASELLQPLQIHGITNQLTASAGVAFIKAKQPFHMAYHLAESLCSAAKQAGRADAQRAQAAAVAPPTLAFHRVTTSMIDDWDTIVRSEKTTRDQRVLTMQPYVNDASYNSALPALADLQTLGDLLADIGHGSVRELLKALYQGKAHTQKAERRLYENLAKRQPKRLANLEQVLYHLTGARQGDSLALFEQSKKDDLAQKCRTPLADAIALADATGLDRKSVRSQGETR